MNAQIIHEDERVGGNALPGQETSALDIMDMVDPFSSAEENHGLFLLALGNDDLEDATRLLPLGVNVNQPFTETGQTAFLRDGSLKPGSDSPLGFLMVNRRSRN